MIRFLGLALSGLGLLYVGLALYRQCWLNACSIPGGWSAWLLGTALFTIGLAALGPCWSLLVWRLRPDEPFPSMRLAGVHYSAQIAKYLPGNVFHYAFRHAGSRTTGASDLALVDAALLESLVLALTALILSAPILVVMWRAVLTHVAGLWMIPLLLIAAPLLLWILRRRFRLQASRRTAMVVVVAFFCTTFFFFLGSLSLWALFSEGRHGVGFFSTLSCFALSWLCGYATPGLPGGIGVRESVLVLSFTLLGAGEVAPAAAVGLRLASIVGDTLLWMLGVALRR